MSSLPASIKRIGSKITEKKWRPHFPHYKSMGAFCCHGNQTFDPICPKTLCSLSLNSMMLHIKFDQDWQTGFRDIFKFKSVKFCHSKASNSKTSGLIQPKIEINRAFMPAWLPATLMMIRSKMNKLAWRHHFPIISLWKFFRCSRAANLIVGGPIWPKFEFVRDFMHVLVTCKYKKDQIKNNREKVETPFSPL